MKKKKLLFIVLVVLLTLTFAFSGCNKNREEYVPKEEDPDSVFTYGKSFGVRPTDEFVAANRVVTIDRNIVNAGLKSGATREELAAAICNLFNVAETNKLNASWFHVRSAAYGEATTTFAKWDVGGKMDIRCITVYNNGEWYDHINGVVVEGIPAGFLKPGKMMLNYSQRKYHYTDESGKDYFYREKTIGLNADADYDPETGVPTGTFYDNSKTDRKEFHDEQVFMDNNYCLNSPLETICLDISSDSLDPDKDLTLSYDASSGLYTMTFSIKIAAHSLEEALALDTSSQEYSDISEYAKYKRDALRESVQSENLEVVQLDYKMEIWDCGYYKNSTSYEDWFATLIIVKNIFEPTGASDNYDCKTFSWDEADCIVSDYTGGEWYKEHTYTVVDK